MGGFKTLQPSGSRYSTENLQMVLRRQLLWAYAWDQRYPTITNQAVLWTAHTRVRSGDVTTICYAKICSEGHYEHSCLWQGHGAHRHQVSPDTTSTWNFGLFFFVRFSHDLFFFFFLHSLFHEMRNLSVCVVKKKKKFKSQMNGRLWMSPCDHR